VRHQKACTDASLTNAAVAHLFIILYWLHY